MAVETENRREIGITRMGQMMLQGWVLTDTPCRNKDCRIPTFRNKANSIIGHCCLCDDESDPIPPITAASKPFFEKTEIVACDFEEHNEYDSDQFKRDFEEPKMDVSGLIGQKLLQGWAMMQECCTSCVSVPLMKSKSNELVCVACNKSSKINQYEENIETESIVRKPISGLVQTPQVEPIRDSTTNTNTDIFEIKQTILLKLSELKNQLSSALHPGDIKTICDAIQSCGNALYIINKL